jgi:hypothetical protein
VEDLTITQQKKRENILKSLRLENIVNGAINTLFTKNQNFNMGFCPFITLCKAGSNERA